MATYLPGVTDIFPEFQPFTPNFDFYNQALQIKHAQYQQGYKKLSGLYNTLLNSPMTRDENLQRRDKYFKDIEGEIKKISGLDLSLPQNVSAAGEIFKPFYEDQDIKTDMYVTKTARDSMTAHEILKNCVGADCGQARAWDEGYKEINYRLQEFKNASTEEARSFGKIGYTPYVRYADEVLKFMKDNKVTIKQEERGGRYNITTTNGPLLEGPLYNMIKTLYEDNSNVKDMYKTKAYVERKDFSFNKAQEFGSPEAAEQEYLKQKLESVSGVLGTQLNEVQEQLDVYTEQRNNLLGKNSLNKKQQEQLQQLEAAIPLLEKSRDSLSSAQSNYSDVNDVDIKTLRSRVDAVVGNVLFDNDIKGMAKDFSKIGYEQTFEEDKYTYAAYTNSLDLNTALVTARYKDKLELESYVQKKKIDFEYEIAKEERLRGKNDPLAIGEGKSTVENVEKIDTKEFNVKTLNQKNDELRDETRAQLTGIYNSLKADNSASARSLIKQIFGEQYVDKKDFNTTNFGTYVGNILPFYQRAKNLLSSHSNDNYRALINPTANASIVEKQTYYNSALKLTRENNNKVKRALIGDGEITATEAKDFFNSAGDVVSKAQFIKSGKYDEDDYDELVEKYSKQYNNSEAPEALRTTMFIGGPFKDNAGAVGIKPGVVSADPMRNMSANFSLVSSVLTNARNSGQFDSDADKGLFNQLYNDYHSQLDTKDANPNRASVTMNYEAVSDKDGFAKVTFTPNRQWLEKNLVGADKTDESAEFNKYAKQGISTYIPNENVHNSFDSRIKNFGDLAFDANGGSLTFGDIQDPSKGGYISMTKNGSQYSTTHKGIRIGQDGEIEFTAPVTNIAYGIDAEKLLQDAIGTIERNNAFILENQIKMNQETLDKGNSRILGK
jgi:hypothetical protein